MLMHQDAQVARVLAVFLQVKEHHLNVTKRTQMNKIARQTKMVVGAPPPHLPHQTPAKTLMGLQKDPFLRTAHVLMPITMSVLQMNVTVPLVKVRSCAALTITIAGLQLQVIAKMVTITAMAIQNEHSCSFWWPICKG